MTMRTIQRIDTVILSLGACRLYGEPTHICKERDLSGQGNGSRSGECLIVG